MKELDIIQSKARLYSAQICQHFDLPECRIWFVDINKKDCIGWYSERTSLEFAYIIVEKNWTRRLVVFLHEMAHHLQSELYNLNEEAPHSSTFQLAKKRIATWARNNISDHFDWENLLTACLDGRRKKIIT